jgi:hypothetical protein
MCWNDASLSAQGRAVPVQHWGWLNRVGGWPHIDGVGFPHGVSGGVWGSFTF